MKKLLIAALSVVALGAFAAPAMANPGGDKPKDDDKKITICHASGQDGTTKFETLTISVNAVFKDQGGHFYENGTPQAGHEQDYLGACVTPPVDMCPNLEGTQTSVPEGMELVDGKCVVKTPPRGQCPYPYTEAEGSTDSVLLCVKETEKIVYVDKIVEKVVTVPSVVYVDREVPVDRVVEKTVEKLVPVEKIVEKPVVQIVTKTKTKVVFKVKYKTKTKTIVKKVVVKTAPKPDKPKKAPKTL